MVTAERMESVRWTMPQAHWIRKCNPQKKNKTDDNKDSYYISNNNKIATDFVESAS